MVFCMRGASNWEPLEAQRSGCLLFNAFPNLAPVRPAPATHQLHTPATPPYPAAPWAQEETPVLARKTASAAASTRAAAAAASTSCLQIPRLSAMWCSPSSAPPPGPLRLSQGLPPSCAPCPLPRAPPLLPRACATCWPLQRRQMQVPRVYAPNPRMHTAAGVPTPRHAIAWPCHTMAWSPT